MVSVLWIVVLNEVYKAHSMISSLNYLVTIHFLCSSWVSAAKYYSEERLASFIWPVIDISYSCLCKSHLSAAIPFPSLPEKFFHPSSLCRTSLSLTIEKFCLSSI